MTDPQPARGSVQDALGLDMSVVWSCLEGRHPALDLARVRLCWEAMAAALAVDDAAVERALVTYTGDFYDQLMMQDEEMIANTRKDMRAALAAALQVKP